MGSSELWFLIGNIISTPFTWVFCSWGHFLVSPFPGFRGLCFWQCLLVCCVWAVGPHTMAERWAAAFSSFTEYYVSVTAAFSWPPSTTCFWKIIKQSPRTFRICKCFAHRVVINISIKQRWFAKQPDIPEKYPAFSAPPPFGALLRAFSESRLNQSSVFRVFPLWNTVLWKSSGLHISDAFLGQAQRSQLS